MSKKNKIGRNDPCPCGSGKKAKKCCGVPGTPQHKAESDQFERDLEYRTIKRWQQYVEKNPEAKPGDTILRLAAKHRLSIGEPWDTQIAEQKRKNKNKTTNLLAMAGMLSMGQGA